MTESNVGLNAGRRTTFVQYAGELILDDAQLRLRRSVTSSRLTLSRLRRDEAGKIEIDASSVMDLRVSSDTFKYDSSECSIVRMRLRPLFTKWMIACRNRELVRKVRDIGQKIRNQLVARSFALWLRLYTRIVRSKFDVDFNKRNEIKIIECPEQSYCTFREIIRTESMHVATFVEDANMEQGQILDGFDCATNVSGETISFKLQNEREEKIEMERKMYERVRENQGNLREAGRHQKELEAKRVISGKQATVNASITKGVKEGYTADKQSQYIDLSFQNVRSDLGGQCQNKQKQEAVEVWLHYIKRRLHDKVLKVLGETHYGSFSIHVNARKCIHTIREVAFRRYREVLVRHCRDLDQRKIALRALVLRVVHLDRQKKVYHSVDCTYAFSRKHHAMLRWFNRVYPCHMEGGAIRDISEKVEMKKDATGNIIEYYSRTRALEKTSRGARHHFYHKDELDAHHHWSLLLVSVIRWNARLESAGHQSCANQQNERLCMYYRLGRIQKQVRRHFLHWYMISRGEYVRLRSHVKARRSAGVFPFDNSEWIPTKCRWNDGRKLRFHKEEQRLRQQYQYDQRLLGARMTLQAAVVQRMLLKSFSSWMTTCLTNRHLYAKKVTNAMTRWRTQCHLKIVNLKVVSLAAQHHKRKQLTRLFDMWINFTLVS